MKDRKKRNIIIGALCSLLVFMGIGYAILSQTLNISGTANMQGNWSVKITNMKLLEANKTGRAENVSNTFTNTTASFEANLWMPGDSIEYEVTVENQGNIDAVLKDIIQTKTNKDKNLKFSNSLIGTEVLTSGSKMSFTMKVEIPEEAETLPEVKESKYEIQLIYIQYNGGEYTPPTQSIGTLAERILADNTALPDTNIDFSEISSDTNGKGLYYTNKNTEDNKTTYYFRGDVTNNYVKFATQTRNTCTYNGKSVAYFDSVNAGFKYEPTASECTSTNVCLNSTYGNLVGVDETTNVTCSTLGGTAATDKATFTPNAIEDIVWRVVRINEDGSVRLITENPVGGSTYSKGINGEYDNAHVGYMYGTTGTSTYKETHKNINDSTIKTYVDNWYKTNLNGYTSYMSTTAGFCNDRSVAPVAKTWEGDDTALGYGGNYTYYGTSNRLNIIYKPQFKCPQENDLFTTATSTNGNKALTYPVGLLTADETSYAGGGVVGATNPDYYLNDLTFSWTMSPIDFGDNTVIIAAIAWEFLRAPADGRLSSNTCSGCGLGVRPVINLSSDVEIISGDGTINNPYVVK